MSYEALSETLISTLLACSNIETDTPFRVTRYRMERLNVHGRERTGCSSENFLLPGQSVIIMGEMEPLLPYYAERDRGLIADRVCTCVLERQKF